MILSFLIKGGYFNDNGIHHFTLVSPLLCTEDEVAYMMAKVTEKSLILDWFGNDRIPAVTEINLG